MIRSVGTRFSGNILPSTMGAPGHCCCGERATSKQPAEGLIAVRSKTSVPNDFFAEQAALHYLWIDWEDLWIDRKGVRHDHFHSEKSGFRAADCRTARGISVGRRR